MYRRWRLPESRFAAGFTTARLDPLSPTPMTRRGRSRTGASAHARPSRPTRTANASAPPPSLDRTRPRSVRPHQQRRPRDGVLPCAALTTSDALLDRALVHWSEHGFGPWAVEVSATGVFIGYTGLMVPGFEAHFTPCVEVGWRLDAKHWGQGLATEAAREATRIGFENLGLNEIVSFTVPGNRRSIRVMEKLSMEREPEEDFDHPLLPEAHPLRRHVLYRLTHSSTATRGSAR